MKVTILEINQNSAQIKIESENRAEKGIWIFHNLAPYTSEFTGLMSELVQSPNPDAVFADIKQKYRGRRVAI
ncbi:hypothetical protein NRA58_06350 [Acinetobacter baumannii]|nr:hypothetical protein [Acinetobacter baumannii]